MIICPYCKFQNRSGILFCDDCGYPLVGEKSVPMPTQQLEIDRIGTAAKATWGTATLSKTSSIIVHIRDADERIEVNIVDSIVFGRSDETSSTKPDIDLMPFGALEKGVSRQHATIERSEDVLTLIDNGSSNGTHLNGQRLQVDQPRVLRDGDEIRLGKLVAHIYFK